MLTIRTRVLAGGAVAVAILIGNVLAQTPQSRILNEAEVLTLIASPDPAGHARLSLHFAALAERHEAETRRHTSMSRSFVGNPSRTLGTGMSAHCRRLTELNTESATVLREMATYHQKLASGVTAQQPAGGAQFERGAGASAPTDEELSTLAAKASTPADHRALAEYFLGASKRYTSDASNHTASARAYRGLPRSPAGAAGMAVHCDRLATLARDAAKEATAAAEMHKQAEGR